MKPIQQKVPSKSAFAAGHKQPEATRTLWTGFEPLGLADEVSSGDRKQELPPTPVSGVVLRDGSLVELIRNPRSRAVALIHQKSGGKTTITREVVCDDYRYVATEAVRHIPHLPSEPMPSDSTAALFRAVADFIAKHSGLGEEEVALLAFFGICTFFCDCLTLAPCLLLFGAPFQAVTLLQVLACVCRHPVLSLGSSMSGLAAELRPTRMICQSDAGVERQLAGFQFSGFTLLNARPR